MNANLAKATAVGALGGLLFGFDTAVISGTTHSLTIAYGLSPKALGITVAMALVGTIIGAMTAGIPGQKWGGRETLRVLAVFYVISALGCAFAWNWEALLVARFIGGSASEDLRCSVPFTSQNSPPPKYADVSSELSKSTSSSAFCSLTSPTTVSASSAWAPPSGAGSLASPQFRRFFFSFCFSAFRQVRAGSSLKNASMRRAPFCK